MVIPKFMTYIVNIFGRDIPFDNLQAIWPNIVILDYFSGGHKNDHWGYGGLRPVVT